MKVEFTVALQKDESERDGLRRVAKDILAKIRPTHYHIPK